MSDEQEWMEVHIDGGPMVRFNSKDGGKTVHPDDKSKLDEFNAIRKPRKVLSVWTSREVDGRPESIKYPAGVRAEINDGCLTVFAVDNEPIAGFGAGQWKTWGFVSGFQKFQMDWFPNKALNSGVGRIEVNGPVYKDSPSGKFSGPYVWAFFDDKSRCLFTKDGKVVISNKAKVEEDDGTWMGMPVLIPANFEPKVDIEDIHK